MSNNAKKLFDNMENLDRELEESKNKYTSLSRKMRIYIFSLFLILSITADLEHGIFNSSIDYLQKDLNMNNAEYGFLYQFPHRENGRNNIFYVCA